MSAAGGHCFDLSEMISKSLVLVLWEISGLTRLPQSINQSISQPNLLNFDHKNTENCIGTTNKRRLALEFGFSCPNPLTWLIYCCYEACMPEDRSVSHMFVTYYCPQAIMVLVLHGLCIID